MKRYLAPLLILAILLLAGSSLWLRSGSVPAAETGSQAESAAQAGSYDESGDVPAPVEPTAGDGNTFSAAEPTASDPVSPENTSSPSASDLPSSPPVSTVPSADSQPSSAQKSIAPSAPSSTATAASGSTPETQPAVPAEDPAAMAEELLTGINQARSAAGISPLTLDPALSSVAQLRAEECTLQFGHTRPDGTPYRSAVTDAGLIYQYLGENLATGQSSVQAVLQSWDHSDGHHDNLVSEDFTKVGIGLVKNDGDPYAGYTWAIVFSG